MRRKKAENIGLSQLIPERKETPWWVVVCPHYWGAATSLLKACENAFKAGAKNACEVVVCRCDSDSYVDEVDGSLYTKQRSEVYKGKALSLSKAVFGRMEKIAEANIK